MCIDVLWLLRSYKQWCQLKLFTELEKNNLNSGLVVEDNISIIISSVVSELTFIEANLFVFRDC